MVGRARLIRLTVSLPLVAVLALAAGTVARGQAPAVPPQGPGLVPNGDAAKGNAGAGDATVATVGAHPLQPALELAQKGLAGLRGTIKDYSCTVVKRERIDGKLGDHE